MSIISLEQQKQLGRLLERTRQNNQDEPGSTDPDENTGETGGMSAVGTASFIMLGGFAILKDIFDFVFVSMLNFKSWQTTVANIADYIPNLAKTNWVAWAIEVGKWGLVFWGQVRDAEIKATGVTLPFLFTTMFMIIVVATLLLSGMGLKSYKIFLSTRFIVASFFGFFAEIIPGLNILPWTVIYVVFLYFFVKRELKKQQEKTQPAQELA